MSPELGEHVEELARDLGVLVIPDWAGSIRGEGLRGGAGELRLEDGERQPVIWVSAPPDSAEPYLLALHELGHHAVAEHTCAVDGKSRPCDESPGCGCGERTTLNEETWAWFWAAQQSLIPITPRLRAFIERRLDSYRD